jgi:transcriptional regulator with XRE-family HTH domain
MYYVKQYFEGVKPVIGESRDINIPVVRQEVFMRITRKIQCSFRQRLKELRQARGLTQAELAKLIGSSQQIVEHYENRAKCPPVAMIPVIAKALKVSTDELLGIKKFKDEELSKNKNLMRRFKIVEALPLRDQRALFHFLNMLIQKNHGKRVPHLQIQNKNGSN